MITVERILDIFDDHGYKVHGYEEGDELCGYEIETWTEALGINMVHFIDCRNQDYEGGSVTPEKIVEELRDIWNGFDANQEAVSHWEAYPELRGYGLRLLLEDMENYDSKLGDVVHDVTRKYMYEEDQ